MARLEREDITGLAITIDARHTRTSTDAVLRSTDTAVRRRRSSRREAQRCSMGVRSSVMTRSDAWASPRATWRTPPSRSATGTGRCPPRRWRCGPVDHQRHLAHHRATVHRRDVVAPHVDAGVALEDHVAVRARIALVQQDVARRTPPRRTARPHAAGPRRRSRRRTAPPTTGPPVPTASFAATWDPLVDTPANPPTNAIFPRAAGARPDDRATALRVSAAVASPRGPGAVR